MVEGVKRKKVKAIGMKGKGAFKTLNSVDAEWLRLASRDVDCYRWRDKQCKLCSGTLDA